MSTRVEGGTVMVVVNAKAMLSAGTAHLNLSVQEGPEPGTWRYNLAAGTRNRVQYGRVAGITGHVDVLRYAAGKRDSIEAHLTIVFAALAVSRWIEARTGWSIRKFVRTAAATAPFRSRPDGKLDRPGNLGGRDTWEDAGS
jgi:hypothetical protein